MRRLGLRSLGSAIVALATLAACSSSTDASAATNTVTGNWRELAVNGKPLPFDFAADSRLAAGKLTLWDNGTFSYLSTTYHIVGGAVVDSLIAISDRGLWTAAGTQVVLTADGNSDHPDTGTVAGDRLTFRGDNVVEYGR